MYKNEIDNILLFTKSFDLVNQKMNWAHFKVILNPGILYMSIKTQRGKSGKKKN